MPTELTTIFFCFVSMAACLSITTYLKLPNVVGYLVAGILTGPLLGTGADGDEALSFLEVGVLMLLFSVGLRVDALFLIRNTKRFAFAAFASFGITAAIYATILYFLDMFSAKAALAVAMAMAFSSQMVAFQSQDISKIMKTAGGQFAIFSLILQLFIFSALVVFLDYLAGPEISSKNVLADPAAMMFSIIPVALILSALNRWIIPYVVGADNKDLLLAIVIASLLAIAFYANMVGVSSPILFLVAGVCLSKSPYSLDIMKFIEPIVGAFTGLYLFFLGFNLDFGSIGDSALLLAIAFPLLMLIKAAVLLGFGYHKVGSVRAAREYIKIMLPTSETGVIVFSILSVSGKITVSLATLLSSYAVLGMILIPLLTERRSRRSVPTSEVRRLRVFFSYSRRDEHAVKAVAARFEAVGLVPLIDTRVLPSGREWQQQLAFAIRSCDVMLWFISPDSAESKTCVWELHQAINLQKRVVPVRLVETNPDVIPRELAAIQFLPATESFVIERDDHWSALFDAVTEHDDWIRFRTSLLEKATSWGASGRNNNYMLLGREELAVVDKWWDLRPSSEPPLSFTVTEFVSTSREALSMSGSSGAAPSSS
ncbi:TIR domain-containing protein [Rhizobium grahamii]|uniref:TIR domain-containing protein n=1 Tax=Rhizobium grahamii TaxID=1120045 RepID=A0A370KHU6_9HYPH|nr:TIR domain-containing protein [Rhizobium grahamii]RDJ05084.1 hypothetical protein B5K06_26300 [Rhizobium grahamii]